MNKIIEQLKQQRERAEHKFVEMSVIKRYSKEDEPCPDTESYLDEIIALNKAIAVLEESIMPDASQE
jgi:hypothetical protein